MLGLKNANELKQYIEENLENFQDPQRKHVHIRLTF